MFLFSCPFYSTSTVGEEPTVKNHTGKEQAYTQTASHFTLNFTMSKNNLLSALVMAEWEVKQADAKAASFKDTLSSPEYLSRKTDS